MVWPFFFSRGHMLWSGCNFGPEFYFESGPKLRVRHLFERWPKLHFDMSSGLKVLFLSEIYDHTSTCSFGPLSKILNAQFWSEFEVKLWTKIASAKQIQHVILNSFKHFLELKFWLPKFTKKKFLRKFPNNLPKSKCHYAMKIYFFRCRRDGNWNDLTVLAKNVILILKNLTA